MSTHRHIDTNKRTVQLEFTDGATYGPVELNPTTDALTDRDARYTTRRSRRERPSSGQAIAKSRQLRTCGVWRRISCGLSAAQLCRPDRSDTGCDSKPLRWLSSLHVLFGRSERDHAPVMYACRVVSRGFEGKGSQGKLRAYFDDNCRVSFLNVIYCVDKKEAGRWSWH
jgi:hypothetical protein